MKCKKYEEKIILYLYGELSDKEKADLQSHIQECSSCARDLEYTKKVFKALDDSKGEAPQANWEKSWKEISSTTQVQPREKKSFLLTQRWVYAGAALLVVFVLGALLGRFLFFPVKESPFRAGAAPAAMNPALIEYMDELKPILIEYANYTSLEGTEEAMLIDKDTLRSLLVQNLLLKDIIAKSNPSLLPFLDDLDLVLKELSNMKRGDKQTPSMIKELIQEREILFKMEIFQSM
jgi:hypothetical protein